MAHAYDNQDGMAMAEERGGAVAMDLQDIGGRPYTFMFIAYAVVLGLIAVFVVSIAVRLARVEKRLQGD